MVEITEESSERHENEGPSTSTSAPPPRAITISEFVRERTTDVVLCGTRLMTLVFALTYLLPFASPPTQYSAYYKAFAAAAATNALRVHQRVGGVSFTRDFLVRVLAEDACHYLMYAVLFITASPVTMALLPVCLFALLHSANFISQAAAATGNSNNPFVVKIQALSNQQTQNSLGVIACAEIFLVPILISMIFMGKASLFLPFVYYRFLTLRYASRRNPYSRQAFAQMRYSLEGVCASPSCPSAVRALVQKSIRVIESLAPAYA